MVRAAAVLGAGALGFYYAASESLPDVGLWWDVAFMALVLMPLVFLMPLAALPATQAPARRIGLAALALGALTAVLEVAGLDVAANFTKFAAVTAVGWWFLAYFESVTWVLLVAILIVPVDIISVARGPTKVIVEEQPEVFDALSIAFPVLGEQNSAQLGLPDVLFFALFLGATVRFVLRTWPTWVLMTLSFGATIAAAVHWDVGGLPALPLLSLGFLLPNADLVWKAWRRSRSPAT